MRILHMTTELYTYKAHTAIVIHAIAILQCKLKIFIYMNIHEQSYLKIFHILLTCFGTEPEMIPNRWGPKC